MYFCKKNMKKILIFFIFIATLSVLTSCSMYKEPCDGVGSINENFDNKT